MPEARINQFGILKIFSDSYYWKSNPCLLYNDIKSFWYSLELRLISSDQEYTICFQKNAL